MLVIDIEHKIFTSDSRLAFVCNPIFIETFTLFRVISHVASVESVVKYSIDSRRALVFIDT
jgi:hypothetical protein